MEINQGFYKVEIMEGEYKLKPNFQLLKENNIETHDFSNIVYYNFENFAQGVTAFAKEVRNIMNNTEYCPYCKTRKPKHHVSPITANGYSFCLDCAKEMGGEKIVKQIQAQIEVNRDECLMINALQIKSLEFELKACSVNMIVSKDTISITDETCEQVCIQIDQNRFLYSQNDNPNEEITDWAEYRTEILDYRDYESKIKDAIHGFYSNLDEVQKTYPDDWKQIVCECAFKNFI